MHGRTDADLLRLAREGDARAYEAIIARYREPMRRLCARITPERAEDAVQHALLSAWVALERGAPVRELRPWLFSIARNAAIDQARGVRSEQVELRPDVPGGEDPAVAEARRQEMVQVLEAVAALPERQRRALVDTALHGRATAAVAVDLGLSGGALRQLVHRARSTVRAAVPSVAFPMPAWLAELVGEEGVRRGAVLLGSGSGAAIVAKTSATVATLGAVVAGGTALDAAPPRSSTSAPTVARPAAAATAPVARPAWRDATSATGRAVPRIVALPTALISSRDVARSEPSSRRPAPHEGTSEPAHGPSPQDRAPGSGGRHDALDPLAANDAHAQEATMPARAPRSEPSREQRERTRPAPVAEAAREPGDEPARSGGRHHPTADGEPRPGSAPSELADARPRPSQSASTTTTVVAAAPAAPAAGVAESTEHPHRDNLVPAPSSE